MAKKTLRQYMEEDEFYYVPEIFDCISTRAAAMTGFKMIMISSSDFSCSQGGNPDLNLMTAEDYARMTRAIKRMDKIHGGDLPLFIDADEGFGSPLQTYFGINVMAQAGADCILITDGNELGRPGLAPIEVACERLRAAKKGMEDTDCLLMASCKQDVDEHFEDFVTRCNAYIEAGADMICPLAIQHAKDGKMNGARRVAERVHIPFWYPDLDPGDKAEDAAELLKLGYHFTGIHTAFRAAMYAMLDSSRHVYELKNNDYVMEHYDYTGFHFWYSPMTCFLKDGKWVELESSFLNHPEDGLCLRKQKGFCGPTDKLTSDKPL